MADSTQTQRMRPGGWVLIGLGAVALAAAVVLALISPAPDLWVYTLGAQAWLDGLPLYSPTPPILAELGLPFTYPPFAAVVFAALAVIPIKAAAGLLAVLGLGALAYTCLIFARGVHGRGPKALALAVIVAGAGALLFDPLRTTLMAGQVNLIIMGLIAADLLAPRPKWLPRGVLVGLAAAIKLTPLVFLLFFVPTRQWRAAGTVVASFVGFSALAGFVLPRDSGDYWLNHLFSAGGIGPETWPVNQSLRSMLHRFGLDGAVHTVAWVLLGAAVVAAAWVAVRRLRAADHDAVALLVVAAAGVLVSPVSWTHHYVWIAPAAVLMASYARKRAHVPTYIGVAVVFAVFVVGMAYNMTLSGDMGTEWTVLDHLLGDSYLWVVLAFLVGAAAHRPFVPTPSLLERPEVERTPVPTP
ncbi:glycosyltransferase family 87 protein [Actinokineospora sp. 24-640]